MLPGGQIDASQAKVRLLREKYSEEFLARLFLTPPFCCLEDEGGLRPDNCWLAREQFRAKKIVTGQTAPRGARSGWGLLDVPPSREPLSLARVWLVFLCFDLLAMSEFVRPEKTTTVSVFIRVYIENIHFAHVELLP